MPPGTVLDGHVTSAGVVWKIQMAASNISRIVGVMKDAGLCGMR